MTTLCIIISVLLVTTIFSVADMMIRAENSFLLEKHGNWHIQISNIAQETAKEIGRRPDIAAIGWSQQFNTDADKPYYIEDKKATLYGMDEVYMTQIANGLQEGTFPQNDQEVILSSNAKNAIHTQIGDLVTIHTPAGDIDFTVCGFGSDDEEYYQGQTYLIGVSMTQTAFTALMNENNLTDAPICYLQFQDAKRAAKAIAELPQQYSLPEDSISENTAIMGISGASSNKTMNNIYKIAAILFILVLLAGILMISGSINSNIAQRTQFFGMMRCIGASRRQIIRFVRLESLNWCKNAVPVGVILGTGISWGICCFLHYGIGGEFATMPVFSLSPVGVISGAVVGVLAVFLAAQSPARRAAKVSPAAAVSGNTQTTPSIRHAVKVTFGRIEWTLGIHHATASKRNWFIMTASFSLSIILFLCFSVGFDFMRELIPTLRSWQPDLVLNGYANALVLDNNMYQEISAIPGVKHTFAGSYIHGIPAASSREGIDSINLVSYSDYLLDQSKKHLTQGNLSDIYGDSNNVMTILNKDNPLKVGDTIQIAGQELTITCSVSDGLFNSELIIICSQETFYRLTGESNYTLIGIQLGADATDETVQKISDFSADNIIFEDSRQLNQENRATYIATRFIGYGFLAIIAMITMFHIINSIAMSVIARIKQYGSMRAVGMDGRQLTHMIAAEAFTYAFSGLLIGCSVGLALNRFLHIHLLTHFFGIAWRPPIALLGIIFVFIFISALSAVYAPAKRMRNMAVTETINEL